MYLHNPSPHSSSHFHLSKREEDEDSSLPFYTCDRSKYTRGCFMDPTYCCPLGGACCGTSCCQAGYDCNSDRTGCCKRGTFCDRESDKRDTVEIIKLGRVYKTTTGSSTTESASVSTSGITIGTEEMGVIVANPNVEMPKPEPTQTLSEPLENVKTVTSPPKTITELASPTTASPFSESSPLPPTGIESPNVGAIAGGTVTGILIIAVFCFFILRRYRGRKSVGSPKTGKKKSRKGGPVVELAAGETFQELEGTEKLALDRVHELEESRAMPVELPSGRYPYG